MAASIEFLNELADRFSTATQANQKTKGRRGSLVSLGSEDAEEIFLAGDLHGNRTNFNKLVKAADLDRHPRRHLVLQEVVHGGPKYPNGADMSHMLLEDVAKLKVKYPHRFHFLLCNHELAECLKMPLAKAGVSQTFQFAMGVEHAYGPAGKRIAELYRAFIRSCPLGIRLKNGVFISHSLPDKSAIRGFDVKVLLRELTEQDLIAGGSGYNLVWGRDYDVEHVKRFLAMVKSTVLLTGHEPCPEGYKRPNDHQLVFDGSGPNCHLCVAPTGRAVTAVELEAALQRL